MDLKNLAVGMMLMCLTILTFVYVFNPMFNDATYGLPADTSSLAIFNTTSNSINSLSNTSYSRLTQLAPDSSGAGIGKVGVSALALFGVTLWDTLKFSVIVLPTLFVNIIYSVAASFSIPSFVVSIILGIFLISVAFSIIYLFFRSNLS